MLRMQTAVAVAATLWMGAMGVEGADDERSPKTQTRAAADAKLSKEELSRFATGIEEVVASGDIDDFKKLYDWDTFLERATSGVGDSADISKARREFAAGFKESVQGANSLQAAIIANLEAGGRYDFLRLREYNQQLQALFRYVDAETGAVNYHGFVVERRLQGRLRIVDSYFFSLGEFFSETVRRSFLQLAANASGGKAASDPQVKDFVASVPIMLRAQEASNKERHQEAYEIYNTLPESVYREKFAVIMRLRLAAMISAEAYTETLEELDAWYPDDPAKELFAIDLHVTREEFDKALLAVDALDKSVGGDPYLNVFRANLQLYKGSLQAAAKFAKAAIQANDDFEEAYVTLYSISIAEGDFTETVRVLGVLEERFGYDFGFLVEDPAAAVADDPTLEDLLDSPEFAEWAETRGE